MERQIPGVHHITAIAGNPRRNVAFYSGVLGQRLVKKTVNFDDPGTYHLYYGDEQGNPGTILTFFPFAGIPRGTRGVGQVAAVAFAIPTASLGYWRERLTAHGATIEEAEMRFGDRVLAFADPDGLQLELVTTEESTSQSTWTQGPVPAEHAIRGFHAATLWVRSHEPTRRVLTELMGFRFVGEEGDRIRYAARDGASGLVDVVAMPAAPQGNGAAGTVHHIAWRTPDDAQQLAWQRELARHGLSVTPVRDRQYFHSIYFHEPGGVLFEIATDPPGFAIDEPVAELGTGLMLPPWLEPHRAELAQILPPLDTAVIIEAAV